MDPLRTLRSRLYVSRHHAQPSPFAHLARSRPPRTPLAVCAGAPAVSALARFARASPASLRSVRLARFASPVSLRPFATYVIDTPPENKM